MGIAMGAPRHLGVLISLMPSDSPWLSLLLELKEKAQAITTDYGFVGAAGREQMQEIRTTLREIVEAIVPDFKIKDSTTPWEAAVLAAYLNNSHSGYSLLMERDHGRVCYVGGYAPIAAPRVDPIKYGASL